MGRSPPRPKGLRTLAQPGYTAEQEERIRNKAVEDVAQFADCSICGRHLISKKGEVNWRAVFGGTTVCFEGKHWWQRRRHRGGHTPVEESIKTLEEIVEATHKGKEEEKDIFDYVLGD